MVIEKQNGSVLVHLGPKLQAYPEELVSQRHGHNRQTEYLIRWHVLSSENGSGSTTSTSLIESKMENILMWMPADDVSANCPTLLGKRKPKKQQLEQRASHIFSPEVTLDEASLLEMKKDVKNLVQRASWQMESSMVPQSSILNTIHVLSAYASIPSLMGVFKETGALDLLMKMLCHTEKQIRCSAGKMLRALASHDAGSRAYVLLSLSQQDGIEQHMDFDSRCTLLELFAETTSSEEHGMSFEGIPLPQIPGKLLFSLVKLYLCATFLLDKLNSTAERAVGSDHFVISSASSEGKKKLLREFDFSMAMAHLISELVRVMGWDHGLNLRHCRAKQPRGIQSIFQRQIPTCASIPSDTPLNHKEESTFKSRSAFPSRNCYMEYLKEKLVHGMRVRMLESYEKVSAGDEGEFLQSNNGTPPLQVYWESLGRTYWVHWHMVEIVDSSRCADQEAQKMVSSLTQILREDTGLYSLLYLRDQINEESGNLNRAEWWELLFFVKKLELSKQQELLEFIQQNQKMSELDEEGLIQLSVSVELAQQVLRILNNHCQGCTRSDLQSSQVYLKYSTGKQRTEQNCQHVNGVPANCDGFSEDLPSKKPKKKLVSAEVPSPATTMVEKTDIQLTNDLLKKCWRRRIDREASDMLHATQKPCWGPHWPIIIIITIIIKNCYPPLLMALHCLQIIQKFTHFLYRLATLNKDCAVLMCCMGAQDILTKVVEKHSSSLLWVTELREILGKCEKYASLYKTMTVSILAGCIQVNLGFLAGSSTYQPFFDVFLHNLCQGCSMEVKEDKCWEKIEVSSNPQMASKLTDGNSKTFWESNGSTGSHYINVYMHHGVVVQYMSLLVASEDASYMPARIMVKGGESASSISTKLNMVSIPPLASKVILLENMSCFWPIIQIKIKRCQQGGIDTRVHGLKVLGPKPTVWPIFKEQLCRRTSLFYTTKAHTWCQEISEDRMQLLHLFNRLNSALRHEQVFADHFLPHDEAAQALGKTCWEALITPVVQSITSPDPSGISPLSWLLSQYLENLEIARKAKSRAAIFNSRVRRLSHLLVHSDSSSPEPEELKPPVKSSNSGAAKTVVNKPSSTTDITQCWKGVVQQQVKWFLETSWQTSNFVEQYCNTYLRLRTAMEELFGQQMSFMLALRHGFSGALLQLSFLRAMHVSEQFARYIDRWIRESWGDSGNVETLWHLQQSLEPILFLAGLELANTFEHFYRLYLGDRLLSQGKSWLECAVVEHIGLCFPNRLPQQMLKSLSELEEQQQQFHLFQLQQLDKRLLEFDHDGKCEEEEEGEVSGAGIERDLDLLSIKTEVKVLVLSPRCWTISPHCYLEEPANFFPSSLSQQLDRFADFYTQSQSRFGLEHTNLRHFQWTWLGHAELEYQGCKLHVSTLQMYILLCFNSAQVLSALNLTGFANQTNGLPVTGNRGIWSLNQVQLSGQHLWLLPRPEYLNVGGDEGHTLKKKRDIICSLLIQILKEEKEIHIDKLLFKVIDAYQKREHGSTPRLTGVFFSSADVLSCILHLLNQGSAQRKENHPEFLEYVSTECSTQVLPKNQLQATFQTVQIKKVCNVPSVEKRQTFSTFR
uniref:Cullin 7 n=1 Tax=Anolis carolinensis TaxID=28377 RepID=A0A803SWW3_ANOCA